MLRAASSRSVTWQRGEKEWRDEGADNPNRGAGLLYVHTLKVKVRNLLKFNVGIRSSFGKPSLRQKEGRATAIATDRDHGTQKH